MTTQEKDQRTWSNPYATCDTDRLLQVAAELDSSATPQPWMIASSNSQRRINQCARHAKDGGVISGTVTPDGVPDLTGDNLNSDLKFACEARSLVPELALRLQLARSQLKGMGRLLEVAGAELDRLREKIGSDHG